MTDKSSSRYSEICESDRRGSSGESSRIVDGRSDGKRNSRSSNERRNDRSSKRDHDQSRRNRATRGSSRSDRGDRYEGRENRRHCGERRPWDADRDRDSRKTDMHRGSSRSQRSLLGEENSGKPDRRPHRWTSDRRNVWDDDVIKRSPLTRLDDHEYPSLGSDDQSTPSRLPRKYRKVSEGSTDWATQAEEHEAEEVRAKKDLQKYRRRLELWSSSAGKHTNKDEDLEEEKGTSESKKKGAHAKFEADPVVLIRRQKQIDYGKNTVGYDNYTATIKRKERVKGQHPYTPNKFQVASRRSWEMQIKIWRAKLHDYDPPHLLKTKPEKTKDYMLCDDTSSQASSEAEVNKPDAELLNTSIHSVTSSISDCYLASDEGSRRSTPVAELEVLDARTSIADSEGVGMEEDDDEENTLTEFPDEIGLKCHKTYPNSSMCIKIPTPYATPAEPEGCPSSPPLNTNDLVAALQRVVVTQQQAVFDYNHYNSVPVCVTSSIMSNNNGPNGVSLSSTTGSITATIHKPRAVFQEQTRKPTILDGFNLDDCFLKDDEYMADVQ